MAYKQKGKLASSSACFFLGGGLEIIFDIFTPAWGDDPIWVRFPLSGSTTTYNYVSPIFKSL